MASPEQLDQDKPQTGCTDPSVEVIVAHDPNWYAEGTEPQGTIHNPNPNPAVRRQWLALGLEE